MATIKEVAKLAGLSVATVSRALNNSGYVGAESRRKVEAAIKELDFYPSEVARSLYQKKSKLIGLLLPDIANPFFPLLAKGAEDAVNQRGYSLIFGNVQDSIEKEEEYLKIFEQNNIAGVLSAVQGSVKRVKDIPLVSLDRVESTESYSVHTDDYNGGVLAAETISERDPGEVVIMMGPKAIASSFERLAGSIRVLKEKNIPYQLFQTPSFRLAETEQTVLKLFAEYPQMNTVIASNDVYGLAVMREAIKRGINIPDDLQIIGYDNMPFSGIMYPGLSTIAQSTYQIGFKGAELLCDCIEKKPILEKRIQLPVELVMRESLRKKGKHE
ncbi:MAG: LacI family transcriptional regulator [Pisciglobus halotolerans]|nr:LacI family transcriptional regulator [Pisciglobus halotolerans]